MATITELAQMSDNAYSGTASGTQYLGPGSPLLTGLSSNWEVIANSDTQNSSFWSQGYFGVAYYNTVTQEVVIANRGTDLTDGPATALKNLLSDAALGLGLQLQVQTDAADFAQSVIAQLDANKASMPFTSVIETGHSLGGTEAQAAIATLVNDPAHDVPAALVSGVLFNSPGIGSYPAPNPTSYNVIDLYDQGDAIHLAGNTHLGGTGSLALLAAGPNTAALSVLAPGAVAAGGIGIAAVLATALYDIVGPAHSINTIIPDIGAMGADSATGAFNWTSASTPSQVPRTSGNPSLPFYSISNGNLLATDPISGVTATFDLSSINNQNIAATFSGGSGAVAQALDTLGVVSLPLSQLGESLSSISGASLITETIARNPNSGFDITFQDGGLPTPSPNNQYVVTATNPANAFDYVVPGATQNLIETIDNGVNNGSGSIAVLSGASSATLTGGVAVSGQIDDWTDTVNGYTYSFTPAYPDDNFGTFSPFVVLIWRLMAARASDSDPHTKMVALLQPITSVPRVSTRGNCDGYTRKSKCYSEPS
jgi:hypothetical protein